jgi:hypothetical protein
MSNEKVIPISIRGDEAHVRAMIRELATIGLDLADMPRTEEETAALVPHFDALTSRSLDLIEQLNGNVEFARRICVAAFEEAERINSNNEDELSD